MVRDLSLPANPEWLRNLTVARYRPMERLLDERDFEFLAGQPGISAALVRSLRAERRKIFRSYLRSLSRDFGRVCAAIRHLMLYSSHDRPDLAMVLARQRFAFAMGLMGAEVRLAMHACGWSGVSLDVRGLVDALESMRRELSYLVPASAAAAA
jgi:hypothetical protein